MWSFHFSTLVTKPSSEASQLDLDEISPKSWKPANESTFQDSLTGVDGSLVNNIVAFVTLGSFYRPDADRERSIRTRR
jgi:hypothetical protein